MKKIVHFAVKVECLVHDQENFDQYLKDLKEMLIDTGIVGFYGQAFIKKVTRKKSKTVRSAKK